MSNQTDMSTHWKSFFPVPLSLRKKRNYRFLFRLGSLYKAGPALCQLNEISAYANSLVVDT